MCSRAQFGIRWKSALIAIFVVGMQPATSEAWRLWPSFFDDTETPDQAQLVEGDSYHVGPVDGDGAGQTFVPGKTPLVRMDFQIRNDGDTRPGVVELWKWAGTYAKTVARPSLFTDNVELGGNRNEHRLHSFYPRLDVEVGAPYFVEFSAPGRGRYSIKHSSDEIDHYPPGRVRFKGGFRPWTATWDMWFRTFSSARGPRTPPRFASSDPDLPWHEPRRSRRVTKHDYFERIEAHAGDLRDSLLRRCRPSFNGIAILDAFLYEASCRRGECEEEYARNTVRSFQNLHAARHCLPLPGRSGPACNPRCRSASKQGYGLMGPPGIAYRWIRDSPSLAPRDHATIRALFLDAGRRGWNRREVGTHSRALTMALAYLVTATLFPDAPEATAWRAYADRVWQQIWAVKDTREDSANYSAMVWWPALLQFAAVAGIEDEVWSDPGFLALVERFQEHTAPLGVDPDFGQSVGWARATPGLVWLFEKAAARTGDARYKWAAHRIFDYARAHARNDKRGALSESFYLLAWAYLEADDEITAAPPAHRRETSVAGQTQSSARSWTAGGGKPLGQTFVPNGTPLARVDLRVRNLDDPRPATLSLWRWRGSHEATVASAPRYRGTLDLAGRDRETLRSAYPFLDVEPGETWYLELSRPGVPFSLAGSPVGEDPYAGGSLYATDGRARDADLWFVASTLSDNGSTVTTRRRGRYQPRSEWGPLSADRFVFDDAQVPDKLVLRSGFDPRDMHAVFNLLSGYGHGQPELGAMVSLLDRGSLLIADTPFPYWYHGNAPEDESLPLVRRYWGGRHGEAGDHVELTRFSDSRNATVAWFEFDDLGGWGVRQERRLYFVKNRFLLVRDRFTFPERMGVAVGPVWHAGNVHPEHGDDWFVVYYREPLGNVWKYRNPERYALLHFVRRPDRLNEAFEEASYLPPPECPRDSDSDVVRAECRAGPPFILYQRWRGEVSPGESRWFDTLLIPHGPELSPEEAAARVQVLAAGPANVALEVRIGDETWTLADSPNGVPVEAGDLRTDARYALLRTSPRQPDYLLTFDASRFERGATRHRWPVRTSVEIGGSAAPNRP